MFSVQNIANLIKAHVANESFVHALLTSLKLEGVSSLKDAGPTDVAFFFSKHYQNDLTATRAGLVITGKDFVKAIEASGIPQWKKTVFLACDNPYLAMAEVSALFSKRVSNHDHQDTSPKTLIHPTAMVAASARLGKQVTIGAYVVIEDHAIVGDGVVIYPHCYLGMHTQVGDGSVLFPQVTLYEKTILGKRCRIHSGAVIGGDGFGYVQIFDPASKLPVDHRKIYHLGRVVIEDDVEIGANSTVDRGTLGDTTIHSKVKIDNLVQVGHNCEIGEGAILCGCSGMAGSSSLGKFVMLGAQAGTANQVRVGDNAKIAAYGGATKDVPAGAEVAGMPARPAMDHYKMIAIQSKLLRGRK